MAQQQQFKPPPQLTVEQCKKALTEANAAFQEEENKKAMENALALAAGDQMKMMTIVLPLAMQIQQKVIANYGFEPNPMSMGMFAMQCQALSAQDKELADLMEELKVTRNFHNILLHKYRGLQRTAPTYIIISRHGICPL